jgi:ABC-type glycerol-3-phosphate transport system substrate-binding protein
MRPAAPGRREVLKAGAAVALTVFAQPARAAPPEPSAITPALVAAAAREGALTFYTAMDLPVAEVLAKAFETKYSGISVQVERSGSERNFQRIAQEMASNIFACDVINSADAAHFIVWKRNGWLVPHLPEDVARHFPVAHYDADGGV